MWRLKVPGSHKKFLCLLISTEFFFFSGEIPATFKQFFAMTLGLKYLNLSHCKLPIDALKHLLLGLACNEVTSDVELNISNNNIGGAGAGVVENALPGDQ